MEKIKVEGIYQSNGTVRLMPAELTDKLQYNLLAPLGLANSRITGLYLSNKANDKILMRGN